MMLNKVRVQFSRLVLVTAVFIFLAALPTTTPVFAGDCVTAGTGNCGG